MSETLFGGLPLQFGLFDWIEWDQAPASDIFEQRLQMLEYADQAGFFCYHLAEHHVTPLSVAPSPTVFLAAAAQRTQRLRLGPLVYLLPFYNPLRLLHEICMLDHLSRGRLELGVGRGISPGEWPPLCQAALQGWFGHRLAWTAATGCPRLSIAAQQPLHS